MFNKFDVAHFVLLALALLLILAGRLTFFWLYLILVGMITVMLFRILELEEERKPSDKVEKLKAAEMANSLEARISRLRDRVYAELDDIKKRLVDVSSFEDKLERMLERLSAIEAQLKSRLNMADEKLSLLESRISRLEEELGIAE